MPVDNSAVNSIISAYIEGRKIRQTKEEFQNQLEQQKIQQKFHEQEQARAEKMLELHAGQLAAEKEAQARRLDLEEATHKLNAQQQLIQNITQGMVRARNGGQAPQDNSPLSMTQGLQSQQQVDPNSQFMRVGGAVPTSGPSPTVLPNGMQIATPEDLAQQQARVTSIMTPAKAAEAGAVSGAVEEAKVPGMIKLAEATGAQKKAELDLAHRYKLIETNLSNSSREKVAQIRANATMAAAKLGKEVDPEEVSAVANMSALGTLGRKLGTGPTDRAAYVALTKSHEVPLGDKDSEALNKIQEINPLIEKMQAFAAKLPDNAFGANFNKYIRSNPALMNEWSNMQSLMKGYAGSVSQVLGKEAGRKTDKDIERALGIMVESGITGPMAQERLGQMKSQIATNAADVALGSLPEGQKVKVMEARGWNAENLLVPSRHGYVTRYKLGPDGKPLRDKDGDVYKWDNSKGAYVAVH